MSRETTASTSRPGAGGCFVGQAGRGRDDLGRHRREGPLAQGPGDDPVGTGSGVEILLEPDEHERHGRGILREGRAERLEGLPGQVEIALLPVARCRAMRSRTAMLLAPGRAPS